jgi:hypothetical protein
MILDYLFAGTDDPANFAIGQAFPDQNRNLTFLWVRGPDKVSRLYFLPREQSEPTLHVWVHRRFRELFACGELNPNDDARPRSTTHSAYATSSSSIPTLGADPDSWHWYSFNPWAIPRAIS